ncbi:MAG TPA: hypothetical protein VG273_00505 [Bryobacteraceae bacterium]|nr:hypothetical protein [Bryobacteraceae bacterium]
MKPRFIALNILLLAGIAIAVWQARARWAEAADQRVSALNTKAKPVGQLPLAPEPKPDAPPATKYVDVANNNLFSKDRNPNVVVEPTVVEKPKPMPPLPVVYGVMGLPSGVKALMADKADAPSKSVKAGDTIGDFTIASLDTRNVVFKWEGKDISRKIDDLMDRSTRAAPGAGNSPPPPPPPPSVASVAQSQPQQQQVNNPPPPPPSNNARMGAEVGTALQSERVCQPGDTSPAGAVVDGYRKVVVVTPFGNSCRWVAVR